MSLKTLQFPSAQTIVSAAVSAAASAMLLRSIAREYLPQGFQYQIYFRLRKLFSSFSSQVVIVIDEFEGLGYNRLFNSVEAYLRPHKASDTKRFRVTKAKKEKNVSVIMERNEEIMDNFSGVQFTWKLISTRIPTTYIQNPGSKRHDYIAKSELRHYELYFNRKHKDMVFAEYLPYVIEKGKEVKQEQKTMKLFTVRKSRFHSNHGGMWESVNLDHPSTFDTLAMDLEAKQAIMEDLDRFLERKNFYRKVGKAWKRGYLLFGPPGTGKSSLIAAMANYLKFDVYDLELTSVRRNSDLRKLMISTGNRSILVVEDIDCSIELQDRLSKPKASVPSNPFDDQNSKLTLSALLNFIDGLWSSCGDERIIVFTTNHKDRLDPALLRPGRMDMHIHMSYCTLGGFRRLAHNYLGITQHLLFDGVEKLLKTTNVTPAEIAEELLKNEDSEIALRSLMEFLIHKKGGARRSHELCDDNDIQS